MQQSNRNRRNKKSWDEPSIPIATRVCPRCGDAKTRRSLKKSSDRWLKALFYKPYRCRTCRHRFWVMSPLRLVAPIVLILVSGSVLGTMWVSFSKRPVVAKTVPVIPQDQLKILAEKGDAKAELQMGIRYSSPAWAIKDDKIAAQWYEKAARHNLVEAQYRYGLALLEGKGVIQDYKAAFYWLDKAARRGHAQAQYAFGQIFHSGLGIQIDIERAYLWFNLAAAQGERKAISTRNLVVKLLTPDRIAAMQEEAIRIGQAAHKK